ncbi:PH-like domain-containing protein [Arthrobacter antibioticus]|uniref:PH-like domain-containing protein n=1 Tax=Arthrobacter sp. H35-MC1 TaxID=3046203 RepID=UPI0024B9E39C|nr:hypothetical protein [Arthrobacter sp. H35-MC1]MDJ0315911.1 hypothetical protein [Arthrobacter sp. H35-MC1]
MDERILPGILTLMLVVVVFGLMGWGWRNKLKRQAEVAPLPPIPADLGTALISVPGTYVVTTTTGDWLDRLAVHELGIRTPGVVHVYPRGIVMDRSGAQDIFIAKECLTDVGTASGMAGKFVERDGLVVISWFLEETEVDTGFRTTEAGAKRPLMEALQGLLPTEQTATVPNVAENDLEDAEEATVNGTPLTDTPTAEHNGKNN